MENYQFRAVTVEKSGEELDYSSTPIHKDIESFDTIGLYKEKELENGVIVHDQIVDMPFEEFQAVLESRFPNGFDSWSHTFYEISQGIAEMRMKPIEEWSEEMQDLQKSEGSVAFYSIAKKWAFEFEIKHKGRFWDGEFFEEVDEFVEKKLGGEE